MQDWRRALRASLTSGVALACAGAVLGAGACGAGGCCVGVWANAGEIESSRAAARTRFRRMHISVMKSHTSGTNGRPWAILRVQNKFVLMGLNANLWCRCAIESL